MKQLSLIILLFFILCLSNASSHMCHDPFRPKDHLVLVPDKELIRIERNGEFRMYVENTYRCALQEIQLFVKSHAFDIEIQPPAIERLVPGEQSYFLVSLKLREDFNPGDYPLSVSISAKSAELKPSIEEVGVVVEEAEETEETAPQAEHKDTPAPEQLIEPQVEEAGEVVIRVERFVLAQRYYLYLVPALLLIGFLIWRKYKQQ